MKNLFIAFMAFVFVLGTATVSKSHETNKMQSFGLSWASNYQSWPDGPNNWPHVTGLCHCGKYRICGWPFAVRAGHMRTCMYNCPWIHPYPDYPNGTTNFDQPVPYDVNDPRLEPVLVPYTEEDGVDTGE